MKKVFFILTSFVLVFVFKVSDVNAATLFPYIGGEMGSTSYTTSSGGTSSTKSAGIGYGVFAGLALSRNLAVEGDYTHYGKINNTETYVSALAIYLKGVIPLNYEFHLFGKLGFANLTSHSNGSSNDTGSGLAYALGGSYKVTRQVALFGQYQADDAAIGSSDLKPSMWSLGVKYDFY